MVGIADFVSYAFNNPETGWIIVLIYLAYELRGKRGKIRSLELKVNNAIIVIQALSRQGAESIDENVVDEYLIENGITPDDFIKEDNEGEKSFTTNEGESISSKNPEMNRTDGGLFDLRDVIGTTNDKKENEDETDETDGDSDNEGT